MNPSNYNQPLIFFTKGKGFWEKSIMKYTNFVYRKKGIKLDDAYSHVSMVLPKYGKFWIIETNPTLGVRIKEFKDNPDRYYKQIKECPSTTFTWLCEGQTFMEIFGKVEHMATLNIHYNYLGAASQIVNMPTGIFLGKKQRMDKVYCSQFIAYILYSYFRFEEFKNYNTISIVDLQLSDRFKNI